MSITCHENEQGTIWCCWSQSGGQVMNSMECVCISVHNILNDAKACASKWLLTRDHQPLWLYRMPSVYALTAIPWKKRIPELTSAAIFLKSQGMPQGIAAAHPIALPSCHVALLCPASSASCKYSTNYCIQLDVQRTIASTSSSWQFSTLIVPDCCFDLFVLTPSSLQMYYTDNWFRFKLNCFGVIHAPGSPRLGWLLHTWPARMEKKQSMDNANFYWPSEVGLLDPVQKLLHMLNWTYTLHIDTYWFIYIPTHSSAKLAWLRCQYATLIQYAHCASLKLALSRRELFSHDNAFRKSLESLPRIPCGFKCSLSRCYRCPEVPCTSPRHSSCLFLPQLTGLCRIL